MDTAASAMAFAFLQRAAIALGLASGKLAIATYDPNASSRSHSLIMNLHERNASGAGHNRQPVTLVLCQLGIGGCSSMTLYRLP
jgi:hypothetical protein